MAYLELNLSLLYRENECGTLLPGIRHISVGRLENYFKTPNFERPVLAPFLQLICGHHQKQQLTQPRGVEILVPDNIKYPVEAYDEKVSDVIHEYIGKAQVPAPRRCR